MAWVAKFHTYSATATAAYGTCIGSYTEDKTYAVLHSNPVLFHCGNCVNISNVEHYCECIVYANKQCEHN